MKHRRNGTWFTYAHIKGSGYGCGITRASDQRIFGDGFGWGYSHGYSYDGAECEGDGLKNYIGGRTKPKACYL